MPSGFHNWSATASSNSTADSAINWAEGQSPSSVNDSARAMMAVLAKWLADNSGTLTTGGTSTAYTLTTNTVFTTLALLSGQALTVKFNATNGAAATLNVDGLGAKALETAVGTALPAGQILADSIHRVTYDNANSAFIVQSVFPTDVNSLTAETAPAVADLVALYDSSASAHRKMTLANLLKVVTSLTAETSPATDDELLLYDTSGTSADKITLVNLLKVLNSLTEDTSPDESADFLLSYDTSAGTVKKVKPNSIVTSQMSSAWAYITVSGGTPTVASSFNVSSVTDHGTGDFTINFTNALADANYAVVASTSHASLPGYVGVISRTTSGFRVDVRRASDNTQEDLSFSVTVFGG